MKCGDLLLFRSNSIGSWFIRTWTASDWSHVGIYWEAYGVPMVIEAIEDGVIARPLDKWPPVAYLSTEAQWSDEVGHFALNQFGSKYDWIDFIRSGLNLPARNRGYICSEIAAVILKKAHAKGSDWPDDFLPTPSSLAEALVVAGCQITKIQK
jgi:uncharacterized protein YycO